MKLLFFDQENSFKLALVIVNMIAVQRQMMTEINLRYLDASIVHDLVLF